MLQMLNLKNNGRCPNDLQQKQRAGVLAGSTGNTPKDEAVVATPTLLDFRWSHVHVQKTQRAHVKRSQQPSHLVAPVGEDRTGRYHHVGLVVFPFFSFFFSCLFLFFFSFLFY